MKKVVFIISHLESGSQGLVNILNNNIKCNFFTSNISYTHPDDLNNLFLNEKLKNYSGSVFGDHLLHNTSFYCESFYKMCKFIYVLRSPRQTLNLILSKNYSYSQKNIFNNYILRVRRIYEMIRKTPNSLFLTWEDLQNDATYNIIENYIKVKPLNFNKNYFATCEKNDFNENLILESERYYEKYLYLIKNLGVKCIRY